MNVAALAISALGVPWALVATFVAAPAYARMFADFGTALPRVTQLALTPWLPLALALGSFALVAASSRVTPKWLPIVVALVTLIAQPAVFLVAMYLPVVMIAGAVR